MSESTPYLNDSSQMDPDSANGRWVKLVTYGTANEAELYAAVLAAEGIPSQVFGANINAVDWFWQVFNDVDLMVQPADVVRAKEALSRTSTNDVEPAEEPANAPPPTDEEGRPLVQVAAFETPTELRDAQSVLASEQITAYTPRLVLRGDRPAGVGKRFVLRVTEDDLESARVLLAEEADENREEPRCPKCGSWRVIPKKTFLVGLAELVGLGQPSEYDCLACQYRGPMGEFLHRATK